jgi:co-chaperonin GroES (HSP10)
LIKPCGHRVVVKQDPIEKKSKGGIIIAHENEAAAQQAGVTGTVLAIGPTAWKDPSLGGEPWCKVGDKVLFAKFAGKSFTVPETEEAVLLMNDEDVMGVI